MFSLLALLACNPDLDLTGKDDVVEPEETDTLPPEDDTAPEPEPPPPGVDVDGGPIETFFTFQSETQWPESVAWDRKRGVFLVSSLTMGHLLEISALGVERVMYAPPLEGYQTWGVEADVDRRRAFVCAAWQGGGPVTWHVWVINLDDGSLVYEVPMDTVTPEAQCRDFVIDPDGFVYITDRDHGWIHKLDPVTANLTLFAQDDLLRGGAWSSDGIAITDDGARLLIGISRPPRFVTLPLADPAQLATVALDNTDFQLGGGQGLDGMDLFHGELWVAAVNRLVVLTPTADDWSAATMVSREAPIPGMGAVEKVGDRLFALNGDPIAWTLGIRADLPFELYQIEPAVP
jgi:sugar lactone lactonase YvrE